MVGLGIHPDITDQQALLLSFGYDMQHVLGHRSKVLLTQEDEIIIQTADVAPVALLGRLNFLLQKSAHDLFAARVAV